MRNMKKKIYDELNIGVVGASVAVSIIGAALFGTILLAVIISI